MTLILYVALGNEITLAKVFVIVNLINTFIFSLSVVGLYLGELIKFMVSMRRIQKFLLADEINHTVISQTSENKEKGFLDDRLSFEFKNDGYFYWT